MTSLPPMLTSTLASVYIARKSNRAHRLGEARVRRARSHRFDPCTTTSSRFVASGPGLLYHAKFRDPKKESTLQRRDGDRPDGRRVAAGRTAMVRIHDPGGRDSLGHVRPLSHCSQSKQGSRNTGFARVRPVLGGRALRDIGRRAQCHEVPASDRLDRTIQAMG